MSKFRYFVPRSAAPNVTVHNFSEETYREDDPLRNFWLWSLSLEKGLTYWVNPEGLHTLPKKPVVYWYPRGQAMLVLGDMEASSDIIAYRLIAEGIQSFGTFADADFDHTIKEVFGRRLPR